MSPTTTTTGGHQFIPESSATEYLNPHHHEHNHLRNSNMILGSNQSHFQLHQQQGIHHQEPSPPEIGSTTTMWEDIASSIKKLDPDHADVLLVASCSSTTNGMVHSNSAMSPSSGVPAQHNNFVGMGGDPPQMIVTTLCAPGDNSLMQEQQDCNNYVITSLPNNNGSSVSLIPSNNGDQSSHMNPTIISGDMSDNSFNIAVTSMGPTSATTTAFSSMSFDSTTAATTNAGISSFNSSASHGDGKDVIMTMDSGIVPHDHSHPHIHQQGNSRHSQQQQQHDVNQNPSNPSAITPSVSSQISYQQINPLIMNQSSHSHHHPPHSNPHHIQLQSNAIRSSHRYIL